MRKKYDIFNDGVYLCSTWNTSKREALENFKASPTWVGHKWLTDGREASITDVSRIQVSLSERQN